MFSRESLLIHKRAGGLCLVLLIFVFTCTGPARAEDAQSQVRIGVLAKRGPERCMEKWTPTAEYLSDNIPGHSFEIVPLGYDEISPAVKAGKVDFILTNSSLYVEMEMLYGAGRIATLKNLCMGYVSTTYGGVVFCRADRNDIKRLADLKGKRFMAVDEHSFGGWQMAWREMKDKGINPHRGFKQLLFGGTHDAVIYAVRDGQVDAGTVRTDTLERMQAEGKIRISDFHVIHEHGGGKVCLPFLHSTREYPEWLFARTDHTSIELTEKVAVALMRMPADCPAAKAANCAGWTIPLSYEPVRECLKELRIGPYKDFGKVTLAQTIRNYWYWLIIIAAALAAMGAATIYVIRLNHRLHRTQLELRNELTERKQAEEQIAIFRRFADASGQGFGMAALDGKLTYVNHPFCRILGEDSPDDSLGKSFVSYYSEETQERLRDEILPGVLQGEQWVGELDLVSTAGRVIPTTTNFFTIRDKNDRPVYYAGVFSDITEHKQAEEALQSSESKFRTLYEATSDAVMLLDEKGFFDCNDATLRIFGIADKEEFCRSHPSDLSPPEQPDGMSSITYANNNIAKAMKDGSYRFEHMYRRKDGTDFPAEVLLNRMKLGNRTVLQAVVRDISERKRVEEKIRRLAMIAEQAGEGIAAADLDGNLQFVNMTWARMHGYESGQELVGQHISVCHTPKQMTTNVNPFNDEVRRSGRHMGESEQMRKDGTTFPSEVMVTLLKDGSGKPIGLIAFATDITERKKAEEELLRAKEVAEAATRAKSGFLANMSHEIRTPMTAILGYTDLMMDPKQCASERLNCLAVVRRNGEHLLGLINDILDISRIEAGKFTIEKQPCSIPSVISEVTSTMRVRSDERGISLTAEYTGQLPETIIADQACLRQGLINLVGNAVKFTETGGVRLNISFLPNWRDDEPAVRIDVIDTGIGIAPEDMTRLFKPFVQTDVTTSRKYEGTGLGLAITRHIVESMGGELTSESTPGKGSTFTITIPTGNLDGVRMLDQPEEAVVRLPEAAGYFSSDMLSGKHILLAEDGGDNMRLIKAILRKVGAEVAVAENGRIAVNLAMREPFDAILMDMQMPIMDGYQATSYLRSAGYTGPIIALTAHAMVSDRERCISAGCDDYLTKPIDRTQLVATIAEHLRIDIGGGDGPAAPSEDTGTEVESDDVIRSAFADEADMAGTIDEFVGNLPDCLEEMRRAGANGDHERLRQLAHQLKGAGGSYGYPMLTTAAKTLEDAAKAEDIEAANLAMNRLAGLCRATVRGHEGAGETSAAKTDKSITD